MEVSRSVRGLGLFTTHASKIDEIVLLSGVVMSPAPGTFMYEGDTKRASLCFRSSLKPARSCILGHSMAYFALPTFSAVRPCGLALSGSMIGKLPPFRQASPQEGVSM